MCKDANSILVEVVTVADVDDEQRFDNSLLQIWQLKFGHKAKCSDFFCTRFDKSLKLKFK